MISLIKRFVLQVKLANARRTNAALREQVRVRRVLVYPHRSKKAHQNAVAARKRLELHA